MAGEFCVIIMNEIMIYMIDYIESAIIKLKTDPNLKISFVILLNLIFQIH